MLLQKAKFCLETAYFAGEEDVSRHRGTVNLAIYLAILLISATGLVLFVPRLADIRAVVTGDFQVTSGIAISQDYPEDTRTRDRTVTIQSPATGEEGQCYIFRCPLLETGELVTIRYYQYSKAGFIAQ